MLTVKSASQVMEDREKRQIERASEIHGDGAMALTDEADHVRTALVSRIRKAWHRNRGDKTRVEKILLQCLRARKGEYHPSKLAEIREEGGSEIYVKATTGKVRTGIAHGKAVMMPTGGFSHGISPTRNPEVPPWMAEKATEYLMNNPMFLDEQGRPVELDEQADQMEHMIRVNLQERAKYAAKRMQNKIYDQLQEGEYRTALSDCIDDLFTYTACFLKGPYFVNKPRIRWEMAPNGTHEPIRTIEPVMQWRTINPLDAYPAPGTDSVHKGDFIERLRMSRDELFAMRETPEVYDVDAINRVLQNEQSHRLDNWLWTDSQRQNIAEHTYFWYESTTELDALHWYGEAMGYELIEHGVPASKIKEPLKNYQVDAILVGNEIIKATLNTDPLYRRNVNSTSYEKIPGSVFGNSVATLMEDSQAMINGTARALQNNLAHSSGFQVSVDYTRLHAETDPYDMHPFKVWQGRESEFSGNRPVVEFFQPDSNASTLITVMREFLQQADRDTGIPDFMGGADTQGDAPNSTAMARSLLKNDAAKLLRLALTNLSEDIIEPMIQYVYDYNMMNDPDASLKGNTQIVPKGMNAALQREGAQQQHMAILDLLGNDYDRELIGDERRYAIIRNLLDTFEEIDTDEIIPTEEEIKFKLRKMQETPPPPDPKILKIESDQALAEKRAELDKMKLEQDATIKREQMANEIHKSTMDNETRREVSRDDLDLKMQNEIIKLRTARHSAFEIGQQTADIERMKLEARARELMQKFKNDLQLKKAEVSKAGGNPEDVSLDKDTIRSQVESVLLPLVESFKSDTMKIVEELSNAAVGEESSQEINVHVNMPDCKPSVKKVSTTRDAKGNLQATITPEIDR